MTKTKLAIFVFFSSLFLGGYHYSHTDSFKTAFPSKDFLSMKGTAVSHIVNNSSDSLSGNEIVELQDENGLTIWFGRYFYKDICITGVCRMVKLWIFWDGVGNYLGIQLNEKDPLTKSDHTPFEPQDYIRLDEILSDTVSILKELRYEDLVTEDTHQHSAHDKSEKKLFEVDGYSSATLPSLKESVIKDAVFTCYTLWHTVYGETKMHIDDLLNGRINGRYIDKLLDGRENQKLFALKMIKRNDSLFHQLEPQVLALVASENENIAEGALAVITSQYLRCSDNQLKFIGLMDHASPKIKYEIIYRLQMINQVSADAIILLIDKYLSGKISVGGLNHIFKIIYKQMITNKNSINSREVESRLIQLSKHSDSYTANLTKNFLKTIQ